MADPISPSLNAFVTAWNEATSPQHEAWVIDDLPGVNEAGAFHVDFSETFQLTGVLNPSTDRVVEITLILTAASAAAGDHDHVTERTGDHHGRGSADGTGDHHGGGPGTEASSEEFDAAAARDAAAAMIEATSDAGPEDVEVVLADLGVEPAARLPASEADGEVVQGMALQRRFQLQRFPPVLIVSVRAEEPWEFPE